MKSPANLCGCSERLTIHTARRGRSALHQATGWLVIFDQRNGQPPIAERTSASTAATPSGRQVKVIRA